MKHTIKKLFGQCLSTKVSPQITYCQSTMYKVGCAILDLRINPIYKLWPPSQEFSAGISPNELVFTPLKTLSNTTRSEYLYSFKNKGFFSKSFICGYY